ncbi:DUF1127 domain-containing protein [Rhizobium sp. SSA_523]|uniref:DUF1127 domain-containing protein n=1 Tax=Rhizobium sp. SSA_523 TaxID=2952477 RepID=UPI002090FD52|nr:DUF1127 domain-containing protein [Rhizobium sp. SSA_523]MCO5733155.1 DUF1127 domain-containing protein [Rhizobium sp. SSA_523]WKC24028.1 DUF1127 domain-containing protein [Rhizobium sp. SSA_523]
MSTIHRMTTRLQPVLPPESRSAQTRVVITAVTFLKSVLRAWRNRRAMTVLNELDDYQLQDIGLTRSDVDRALNHSGLMDDPFKLLPPTARLRGSRCTVLPRRNGSFARHPERIGRSA